MHVQRLLATIARAFMSIKCLSACIRLYLGGAPSLGGARTHLLASSSASGSVLPGLRLPVDPLRDAPLPALARSGPTVLQCANLRYGVVMVRVLRGWGRCGTRQYVTLSCVSSTGLIAFASSGCTTRQNRFCAVSAGSDDQSVSDVHDGEILSKPA